MPVNPQAEILSALTVGIVWTFVFWITYFPSRILADRKGKAYTVPFLINMFLGVYIFLGVQPRLLNSLGLNSQTLNFLAIVMTICLIIHHITIEVELNFHGTRKITKRLKLIHHLLSHVIFFSAFALSSLIIGLKLWQRSIPSEISIIGVFLFITLFTSIVGILVGVNKVKLSYS